MRYGHLARQLGVTAFAVGTLCVLPATAAHAHDALVSSYPTAGAVLPVAPRIVTLRMAGDARRATVRLTDGCGRTVPARVVVAGSRISVRLDESHDHGQNAVPGTGVGAGRWRASWRVVGADGHTAAGDVPFTIGGTTRCKELPQPLTQVPPAAGSGTGETPAGAAGSGSGGDVRRTASAGVSSNDRFPVLPVTAIAVVTVALVGGRLLRRRAGARA